MLIECNMDDHIDLMEDDPVRPKMFSYNEQRFDAPFHVFAEQDEDGTILAVMCVLLTHFAPVEEEEIQAIASGDCELRSLNGTDIDLDAPSVAVPYSMWSYSKGAGSKLVRNVIDWVSLKYPSVSAVITMSPKTEMATKFHLHNGAKLYGTNDETNNFYYEVLEDVVLH